MYTSRGDNQTVKAGDKSIFVPGDMVRTDTDRCGDHDVMVTRHPGVESTRNPRVAFVGWRDVGIVLALATSVTGTTPELLVLFPGGIGWNMLTYFSHVNVGER